MTNIVMTCFNRIKLLEQSLKTLYAHTPNDQFSLTCVDDASPDPRIRNLLREYAHHSNFAYMRIEKSDHILSNAKKLGVAWSEIQFGRGDWLCMCDSDVYFCDGWMPQMIGAAMISEHGGFMLWGGQQHPFHHPTPEQGVYKQYYALPGTHWFLRWETWDRFKHELVSEGPGVCRSEDARFCTALREAGGSIGVVEPFVVHDCGWTNSDMKPAPGYDLRVAVPGVYHE